MRSLVVLFGLLVAVASTSAKADLVFTFRGTVDTAGLGLAINDPFTFSFRTIGNPTPTVDAGDVLAWSSASGTPFFTSLTGTGLSGIIDPSITGIQIGVLRSSGTLGTSIFAYNGTATGVSLNGTTLFRLDGGTGLTSASGLLKSTATGVTLEDALNLGTYNLTTPQGIYGGASGSGDQFYATLNSFTIASGSAAAVPEPSSMISLSMACAAYGIYRRKRARRRYKISDLNVGHEIAIENR